MIPGFAVIIPTRNRPEKLRLCLTAIAELDYPNEQFEVIVVNDGGMPIECPRGSSVRIIDQAYAGPAQARNTGAAAAAADFLIFLDDDCAPARDWLTQWEIGIARWPGYALGGWARNGLPRNLFSTASQMLIDYLYSYYNCEAGRRPFVASNNLCVPAAEYRRQGGFSAAFQSAAAEDRDFCDTWLWRGHLIRVVKEAVVDHSHALTLVSFWLQHLGYGKGAALYHVRSAVRREEPVKVEPLRFYTGLILWPFRSGKPGEAFLLASLLALAQVANATGFLMKFRSARRPAVLS